MNNGDRYWQVIWKQFRKHPLGMLALLVVLLFCVVGVYAPFLASSKPLFVCYDGHCYFPLFRYLFFPGFFTKRLDIFFNLLMFTLPAFLITLLLLKKHHALRNGALVLIALAQFGFFLYFGYGGLKDPGSSAILNKERQQALENNRMPSWAKDLSFMTPYAKLNLLIDYKNLKKQNEELKYYSAEYQKYELQKWLTAAAKEKRLELIRQGTAPDKIPDEQNLKKNILLETSKETIADKTAAPTLWNILKNNERERSRRLKQALQRNPEDQSSRAELNYIEDRQNWLEQESKKLSYQVMPLVRHFHWEDDAGGGQSYNQFLPWWDLTRINRKDLLPALIFGIRISLVVGILAVGLSLLIAIPVGAYAGYYGGTFDIIVSRALEIWESMPTFFMLLMIVAITQSKSIFLIILMIGFFGWTGFSRYIRGEFFKQRNLPYVEACHSLGFRDSYIMFSHILPNAIPPVLTLVPFAVMAAITSEAGLSFLGLGEEGSTSWGVLMDEGRTAFPAESYLLWPPAILLTILLVAIALVGDSLRDALDPKMHK